MIWLAPIQKGGEKRSAQSPLTRCPSSDRLFDWLIYMPIATPTSSKTHAIRFRHRWSPPHIAAVSSIN
jgi:hypothetical protein